ncbi:hypothetical protein M409DRAFT_67218 [Zasmidium cellare ATCC 36951]|uniref:Ketoreductase (KR) domain-containing protein n=1 Tax=Zasmidium cellare ATCC 36951 TaxID=1080233 RepID=A0A6A6CGQ0_ZASCE|nr:uncharacterized protein M409DRAFT_67218 [Zasmidium cellare ATCC 36951]KAF2165360.1 hypothetical protein M409DRAFT_67218 [Zasmidium cellare ATCC 36951]
MGNTYSLFFPPPPPLTEDNLPSQSGKVFLVTGGTSGVGYELCKLLYHAGGKVYLSGRTKPSAEAAIERIKASSPSNPSTGELLPFAISLDNLSAIKPAVEDFLAHEPRLDVLFNNAGVSNPPKDSKTAQGHELQMGTNCLGPYLLTQLLLPLLHATAATSPPASVRVVWTSSITVDLGPSPPAHISGMTTPSTNQQTNYAISKYGNWFLAHGLSEQDSSILSVSQNPGNLKTQLTRHMPSIVPLLVGPLLYQPKYGAYTELWCGVSGELGTGDGGAYVLPWGRVHPKPPGRMLEALRGEGEGGTGVAASFVEWCEGETRDYR